MISGGLGADNLGGGTDEDVFLYRSVAGSDASTGVDVIGDFRRGTDLIDLSAIDADITRAGDQDFTFIGAAAFGGTAGELHLVGAGANRFLDGDVDGNGAADFRVQLNGITVLSVFDFVL